VFNGAALDGFFLSYKLNLGLTKGDEMDFHGRELNKVLATDY